MDGQLSPRDQWIVSFLGISPEVFGAAGASPIAAASEAPEDADADADPALYVTDQAFTAEGTAKLPSEKTPAGAAPAPHRYAKVPDQEDEDTEADEAEAADDAERYNDDFREDDEDDDDDDDDGTPYETLDDILRPGAGGDGAAGGAGDLPAWAAGIDLSKVTTGKTIRSGNFGKVSWLDNTGGVPLVIKTPKTAKVSKELQHEAEYYEKIGEHPNIAKCLGMQTIGGKRGLVMEGIRGQNMHGVMDQLQKLSNGDASEMKALGRDRALSHEKAVGTLQYMLAQTLQGMMKMEEAGVVHGDLRHDNIMCDAETGDVKIVDLGLAVDTGERVITRPIGYGAAPPDAKGTNKYDVFGAGAIAYEAMEGDQFRYGTKKRQSDLRPEDMIAFRRRTGDGRLQTALSQGSSDANQIEGIADFDQLEDLNDFDQLDARVGKLFDNPLVRGTRFEARLESARAAAEYNLKNLKDAGDSDASETAAVLKTLVRRIRKTETELLLDIKLKEAGKFGAETAYTRFVNWAMNPDLDERPSAKEALEHPFLAERLLDDDAARQVLKDVLGGGPKPAPAPGGMSPTAGDKGVSVIQPDYVSTSSGEHESALSGDTADAGANPGTEPGPAPGAGGKTTRIESYTTESSNGADATGGPGQSLHTGEDIEPETRPAQDAGGRTAIASNYVTNEDIIAEEEPAAVRRQARS